MNTNYNLLQKRLKTLLQKEYDLEANEAEIQPDNAIEALHTLIQELKTIDPNSPLASLNETTISDNNGGRIELTEDLEASNNIRK